MKNGSNKVVEFSIKYNFICKGIFNLPYLTYRNYDYRINIMDNLIYLNYKCINY